VRREIEFKIKREDGTVYDVRVSPFSGKFKFQFKDKGVEFWDYDRKPDRTDLETLVDTIERRYARRRSSLKDVEAVRKMLQDYERLHRVVEE